MASTIGTAYIQIEPTTKGIGKNLQKEMGSAGTEAGKGFNMSLGKIVSAAAVVGVAAKGAQMTKEFVQGAVGAFGNYEQLVGGVETLFGAGGASLEQFAAESGKDISEVKDQWYSLMSAQKEVLNNADQAYKTAGLSANDYMETVTSFSAALVSSLDGDTATAAKKADMAIVDMSDNANKMGSSMESIQNAYQGFAKQNYTMLDNLKLGYGGTKGEMQRLLEDAQKISGIEYDISSYADVVDAIHIIQENMGIAGTTAKEAESTLQGSLNSMKASWENLTVALAKGDGMDKAINEFVSSAETALKNFEPVIMRSLDSVSTMIQKLLPVIVDKLPAILQQILPSVVQSAVTIVQTLAEGLIAAIPVLVPALVDLVNQLVTMLIEMAPQLIEAGLQLVLTLSLGIAQALPELIPVAIDAILQLVETLVDNVDLLVDSAIAIMNALTLGLINSLPVLIEKAPVIISKLVTALVENAPKLLAAALEAIKTLAKGLGQYLPTLLTQIPGLVTKIISGFLTAFTKIRDVGKKAIEYLWEGIKGAWEWLKSNFLQLVESLISSIIAGFKDGITGGLSGLGGGSGDSSGSSTQSTNNPLVNGYTPSAASFNSGMTTFNQGAANIGGNTTVNVTLEGDANRLFRVVQAEASRNAMLVGV